MITLVPIGEVEPEPPPVSRVGPSGLGSGPRTREPGPGIANVDLYAPGLNFVFGIADTDGRRALISLARLRPEFHGSPPDDTLFLQRAVKEAVHELGHTCGLGHCRDPRCVMFFSNTLHDSDVKGPGFCAACREKVNRGIRG